MSGETLFTNAVFHSGVSEHDAFRHMTVRRGVITGVYQQKPEGVFRHTIDLGGRHIYPCLIDAHVHLLLTVAVMAMGFSVCSITPAGVVPHTLDGVAERIRRYAGKQRNNAVIACSNYILSAMDVHRMPTKQELDDWGGGRPVVVYNIDGHSTSLSTAMLRLLGIDPHGSSGVMQGEENERIQGRLIDVVSSKMTPAMLAKGIAAFQNACAAYGISVVGALEGNGDSPKDVTTQLIAFLARYMDVGVRLYPQYTDIARAAAFRKWMKHPRIGGCGDWEMDGAVGAHSAAFSEPFADTGATAPCYMEQERVNELVQQADAAGFQIASHAIGDAAIHRLITALDTLQTQTLHRIEHCEFPTAESVAALKRGRYAVMMQPGYAWIDKRYLHTYEQFLPQTVRDRMVFRTLVDAGVCVCGSSDSPVQDMDPWLQMLGMTQFYNEQESVSVYDAFRCYTVNAARALQEERERGTLEVGKAADFFTADTDLFSLDRMQVVAFRPVQTWYAGKPCRTQKGRVTELLTMLLKRPRKL